MSKPLTLQLIQQKTKTDSLPSIKNLNLWGNDIDDLKVLRQLPNLEVLSLSVNRISTLKEIATCQKLKELYLRKNNITNLSELRYVQHLPNLKVLWLQDNPCSEIPNYRHIVIHYLPNLEKLDNLNVTQDDKVIASKLQISDTGDAQDYEDEVQNDEDFFKPPVQGFGNDRGYQPPQNQQQKNGNQEITIARDRISVPQEIQKPTTYQPLYQQQPQYQSHFYNPSQIPQPRVSYHEEDNNYKQVNNKNLKLFIKQEEENFQSEREERSENILSAILSLIKELDENSLDIVKKEVDRKISNLRSQRR